MRHEPSKQLLFVCLVATFLLAALTMRAGAQNNDGMSVKINFQPESSEIPAGYLPDVGDKYGGRGDGYRYGWNEDNEENARDRDSSDAPDQRYDTFIHMQLDDTYSWEIGVPDGEYHVYVVMGDPEFDDQINSIDVEGTIRNDPDGEDHFDEYDDVSVTVTDGRLTIQPAPDAENAKIAFIEITSEDATPTPPAPTATSPTATQPPPTPTATSPTATPPSEATSTPTLRPTRTRTPSATPPPETTSTPTATPTKRATVTPPGERYPLYLPAILKPPIVANGGFDTGDLTGWAIDNVSRGFQLNVVEIGSDFAAQLGNPVAECSGGAPYDGAVGFYQQVLVPDTANPTLSFDYLVRSQDTSLFETFNVYIRDEAGNPLEEVLRAGNPGIATMCGAPPWETGWQPKTQSLAAYRGQVVQLYFELRSVDDTAFFNTWAYLDDVVVTGGP
ncbi:MAG: hypothetical protein M3220_01390 [Chloroflexota bacterium]|nr:hypothetical protein [Chloroflexota bacterium]